MKAPTILILGLDICNTDRERSTLRVQQVGILAVAPCVQLSHTIVSGTTGNAIATGGHVTVLRHVHVSHTAVTSLHSYVILHDIQV